MRKIRKEKKRTRYGYWNPITAGEVAAKYKFRSDFMKAASSAYSIAAREGYLDQICAHMGRRGHKYRRGLYVYEFGGWGAYVGLTHDFEERHRGHATKGTTFRDLLMRELIATEPYRLRRTKSFYPNDIAARTEERLKQRYVEAGWLVLNVAKCGSLGSDFGKWTVETLKARTSTYTQLHTFRREEPQAYVAASSMGILREVTAHMTSKIVRIGHWQEKKAVHTEALKYTCASHFRKGSGSAYNSAARNGWLSEVGSHFVSKHQPHGTYSDKSIVQAEALRYTTRLDFHCRSPSAYASAVRNGWLHEVCAHMPKRRTGRHVCSRSTPCKIRSESRTRINKSGHPRVPFAFWTKTTAGERAVKYQFRADFLKAEPGAYDAAWRGGYLDEICAHMVRKTGYTFRRKKVRSEPLPY